MRPSLQVQDQSSNFRIAKIAEEQTTHIALPLSKAIAAVELHVQELFKGSHLKGAIHPQVNPPSLDLLFV